MRRVSQLVRDGSEPQGETPEVAGSSPAASPVLYCDFCEDGLTHAQAVIGGVPMCVSHMGSVSNAALLERWQVGDRVRTVGVCGGSGRVIAVGGITGDLHVLLDDEHDPIWLPIVHAEKVREPWRLSRESAYRVREHGREVLYFKRAASGLFDSREGPWEVVRQEGTARINIGGPNAHRKVLASFPKEADADAFMIAKGARP